MTVVFDTNVVMSAIFWGGASRSCLLLWGRRRFQLAVTGEILGEYERVATRLTLRTNIRSTGHIEWIRTKAKYFEPSLLGKPRSRDQSDDMFLACALASGATYIVSKDNDLLTLQKPFGIEVIEP